MKSHFFFSLKGWNFFNKNKIECKLFTQYLVTKKKMKERKIKSDKNLYCLFEDKIS